MPHSSVVAGTQKRQKDITKPSILGLQTPTKPEKDNRGGKTRWGRLAKNREAELLTTPRSARKFKEEIGLPAAQMPKILDGSKTPPARRRTPFMTIQVSENNSPIRVQVETNIPSPQKPHAKKNLEREFSEAEIRCAHRLPLTRSKIKISKKHISLKSIKKGKNAPRRFRNSLRLPAYIFPRIWGTYNKNRIKSYEKLHMVSHSAGGKDDITNTILGADKANSQMMGPDAGAVALVEKKLCYYVENTVTATLLQKPASKLYTHHADFISMQYKPNNTGLIFSTPPIDGDLEIRPSVDESELNTELMVNCQKAKLAKQARESGNVEKSSTVALPVAHPKRKRENNTLDSYFSITTPVNPTSSVKKRKIRTPETPRYKITTFFPLANQENTLNLQAPGCAPKHTFFTSKSGNTPILATPPSNRPHI